jgi:hypothetical protein
MHKKRSNGGECAPGHIQATLAVPRCAFGGTNQLLGISGWDYWALHPMPLPDETKSEYLKWFEMTRHAGDKRATDALM